MPVLDIETNVSRAEIPDNFMEEMTTLLAELLGKPEKFVCVQVKPDQLMTFGKTRDPAAICTLTSIGKLGLEENKKYSEEIMRKIQEHLKIDPTRMYIFFKDAQRQDVAWNSKTFA